jgi:hypothetical protein
MSTTAESLAFAPPLYPLPNSLVREGARLFSEFTDAELTALSDGNLETLPEGSPERYVLEGRARSDLPETDGAGLAYRAGALLGIAMHRRRRRLLQDAGCEVAEPPFDPESAPVFGSPLHGRLAPDLIRRLYGQAQYYEDVYGRAAQHFERPGSGVYLVGLLKAIWLLRGMSFGAEGIDYASIGLGDALAVYYQQYAEVKPTVPPEYVYSPGRHFRRADKQVHWSRQGRVDWHTIGEGLLEADEETITQVAGGKRLEAGYRAVISGHAQLRPNDKLRPANIEADIWWNSSVPVGSTILDVRRFQALRALDPERHGGVVQAGLKSSLETYALGRHDRLIIEDAEGLLTSLPYPFRVDGRLTAGRKEEVRLLRVCRQGASIDLTDLTKFPAESLEAVNLLTERALAEQPTPGRIRQIGQAILNRLVTNRRAVVGTAATIAATAGSFAAEADRVLPASTVSAAAVFGLAYIAERLQLLKRNKTEQRLLLLPPAGTTLLPEEGAS